ncbi:MAG: hypothetical protein WCI77_08815 [Candidatus Omnitrophota bacterium]
MFSFVNIPATIINFFEPSVSHREIAAGVCFAMLLSFVPWNGVMALMLFLFFFIINVNRIATAISLPMFKLLYIAGVSAITDKIGGYLLIDAKFLANFWRWLTHLPLVALLDINNTLVAGGLAFSCLLLIPVYLIAKFLSVQIRPRVAQKIFDSGFGRWARRIQKIDKVTSRVDRVANRIQK